MLTSLFRLRTIDEQFLRHSEWVRRLGVPTLVGMAGILCIPLGIFVIIPLCLSSIAGPSTLLALVFTFVIVFFAVAHLVELSCALPKNCVLYHFTFASIGELPAFIIGWLSLLDAVCLTTVLCRSWSQHMNILTGGTLMPLATIPMESEGWLLSIDYDIAALSALFLSVAILCCSPTVLGTVSVCLLIVSSLIITSCSMVGFFHADPKNWLDAGFFTNGYQGIIRACSAMICIFSGIETFSFLLEETSHPRKKMPVLVPILTTVFSLFIFFVSIIFSLTTNVSTLPMDITVPDMFTLQNVPSAKYMLTVASVCGLSGAVLVSFLPGTRIIAVLAQDRLLPIPRDSSTRTPFLAVLFFSILTGIGIFIRKDVCINIMCCVGTLKLLVTVCLTHIQHFRPSPIGLQHETNSYHKVRGVERNPYLSYGIDGSGTVSISREHSLSSFSEAVALQMNVARQETDKLQNRLEKKMNENTNLMRDAIPRSVSQYNSIGQTKRSRSISSFAEINHGHNCIEEGCSPSKSSASCSQRVHLYSRTNPDLPYIAHFTADNMGRSGTPIDPCDIFSQSNWLLSLFVTLSLLTSLLVNSLEMDRISSVVLISLLLFLLSLSFLMVVRLPSNKYLFKRQARMPIFPYLSYLTILLLCVVLSSVTGNTLLQLMIWIGIGVSLYFSYGFSHSIERNALASLIIQNPSTREIEEEEMCRAIVNEETSTEDDTENGN